MSILKNTTPEREVSVCDATPSALAHSFQANVALVAKEAISYFLDRTGLTIPSIPRDLELEALVDETITSWGLKEAIHPHEVTANIIAMTGYGHIQNRRTRVHISLYTSLLTTMDEPAVLNSLASDKFHMQFCSGSVQSSDTGMFGRLSQNLLEMWDHYPRFSASAILASTLQFMNATILQNTSGDVLSTFKAESFLKYRRFADGVGEAYTVMIWDGETFPDPTVYAEAIP